MAEAENKSDTQVRVQAGRGPAYPYIPLEKAVERVEQLRVANMARLSSPPLSLYKVWGWSGDNGNARQTLAALNHFGLIEYVGRGEQRVARLTPLAHKIVFDKIPGSQARAAALKEAALNPPVYRKLWDEYSESGLPPDVVIETFLMRDQGFNDSAVRNVISGFRDTIEYAGLDKPDNMPDQISDVDEIEVIAPAPIQAVPPSPAPAIIQSVPLPVASGQNDIKVLLDGNHLKVSAIVDAKGVKKLIRALQMNLELLQDDDEDNSAA